MFVLLLPSPLCCEWTIVKPCCSRVLLSILINFLILIIFELYIVFVGFPSGHSYTGTVSMFFKVLL